nr:hypothetical protein [Anaerolineae bacterium]
MVDHHRINQISGAVFLIGMGIIALLNYWWPGIMFVIGAALLIRAYMTNPKLGYFSPGIIAILIGLLYAFPNIIGNVSSLWPIILILLGLGLLFGKD